MDSIVKRFPEFADRLSSDTDILFWRDRIRHTERHRKDFMSEEEYELCFSRIPSIIQNPDYISIHPNKDSISFICKFTDNVSVAVRLSMDGRLAYRTMYPLRESQLENYITQGRAWRVCKLFKDRTGSYHAPVVLKRCRSAIRLNNLSFIFCAIE